METSARFSSLDRLLRPRSVAVLGASADRTRIGGRPVAYMLDQRFQGEIYPVNPNRNDVQGVHCYPSVPSLPVIPDTAIVALPAGQAVDAIDQLGRHGVKTAIVFSSGFAEMNAAGVEAQAQMLGLARRHGMRILGPNCLGLFNASIGFYGIFSTSFENGWPCPGRIGIASQSGAYGTHVFATARNRRIGTPVCVTTGNEGDITIGDAIGWMADDPGVDVIMAYAEGFREADSLILALSAARDARKPVIMMKVGSSVLGADAARSHTASIAGDDAVTQAVLAEFGVVRARTTEEMLDIAMTAQKRIYPASNTLGVITISGGAGVLISDAAAALGLAMPAMPAASQERLRALVPFAAPRNPVDCTAQAFNDLRLVGEFAETMVAEGQYRSILAFFTQLGGAASTAPGLRQQMRACMAKYPGRLYVLCVVGPPERIIEYEDDGFIVFEDPTRATVAIHAMGVFGDAFTATTTLPLPEVPAVELPPHSPGEADAKKLLATAGVTVAPEIVCQTAGQAVTAAQQFGFPVALKILSPDIKHKSEIGGVLLDVGSEDAVRAGFSGLISKASIARPQARIEGVLVAKQLSGGVECIVSVLMDPVFGPVAMVGLGGIYVEILNDVALHRCPFGTDVAERMIRSLRGAPLLFGARGRANSDVAALASMLAALSAFAVQAGPRLRSVELNPVMVLSAGQGAFALDALLELVEEPA